MRRAALIAVVILAAPAGGARAESFDLGEAYRRTEALVQSLFGPRPDRGGEVIAPPGNIDAKMAFDPPRTGGAMPVIRPSGRPEQRR